MAGIVRESIVDGPGIRFVVFCQGCSHDCPGCHNPETHEPGIGKDTAVSRILEAFDKDPLLDGITLSGGEPFEQPGPMAVLAQGIKDRGKSVFAYSGYTFEQLMDRADSGEHEVLDLLRLCDYLVDGPFILAQRDLSLPWRGSQNQRVLDVPASLAAGEAVWAEQYR